MKLYMRRKARSLLLQALYQIEIVKNPVNETLQHFLQEANPKKVDCRFFEDELLGITNKQKELDNVFIRFLNRPIEQLDIVELVILRIAVYEITVALIPYKVVINEALELTKKFGAVQGYKFINSVLDQVTQFNGLKEDKG